MKLIISNIIKIKYNNFYEYFIYYHLYEIDLTITFFLLKFLWLRAYDVLVCKNKNENEDEIGSWLLCNFKYLKEFKLKILSN